MASPDLGHWQALLLTFSYYVARSPSPCMGLGSIFLSCELNNNKKNYVWGASWALDDLWNLPHEFTSHWLTFHLNSHSDWSNHDYTGNTSSWMKTQYSAKDKPWDPEQVSDLSTLIYCIFTPKCAGHLLSAPQQCASYLIFFKFPRVYGAISNPLFYLILLVTLGRVRTGMKKASLQRRKQKLFVVTWLMGKSQMSE